MARCRGPALAGGIGELAVADVRSVAVGGDGDELAGRQLGTDGSAGSRSVIMSSGPPGLP